MVLKLKIFLVGNYESTPLVKKIQQCLENKYYDVTNFKVYGNYVLDTIAMCKTIKDNIENSVGFVFCNHGKNLDFVINEYIKPVVISKNNKLKKITYYHKNILIFSIKDLQEEEISKAINYYLELFESGNWTFN